MVWIWAAVFIATIVVEVTTVELASVWFAFGSLVSFILALCGAGETVQIIVFAVVSALMFICLRPICMKFLKNSKETTNVDSLIGSVHTLLKDIDDEKFGEIKINGVSWRVSLSGGGKLAAGEKVKIVEVQGNKFVVEKEIKENE